MNQAPNDEPPQAEGSQTEGSQAEGSQTEGSKTEGSQTEGSQTEGSKTEGSKKTLEVSSVCFVPDPLDVVPGDEVTCTWMGSQGFETPIVTYDERGERYPLFGGLTNSYPISNKGTKLTVDSKAPTGKYGVEAPEVAEGPTVPVKGTINVKK